MAGTQTGDKRGIILRWVKRTLLGLFVSVAVLMVAGAIYQAVATEIDAQNYPPPGQMVDIGGRNLHIYCVGTGKPTVVLLSGRGENSLVWSWVQPELAKRTQVCAYDRAGLGWSDPSSEPRDSQHIADELHVLLTHAGIAGPYVLVGHSVGGFYARVFADHYPGEVAGVVLIDSASENQPILGASPATKYSGPEYQAVFAEGLEERRQTAFQFGMCRDILAPLAVMRLIGGIPQPALPAGIQAAAQATSNRTSVCDAVAREHDAFGTSAAQAHAAGALGHLPLVVISRGKPLNLNGLSPEQAARKQRSEDLWRKLQDDLLELAVDSRQIIAKQSGHHIQIDQPRLVIDAIELVVTEARGA